MHWLSQRGLAKIMAVGDVIYCLALVPHTTRCIGDNIRQARFDPIIE